MGKRKLNWITGRKKTEAEVPYTPPVWLGNLSNGEFFLPQGDRERKVQELILNRCDEFARKVGMERREFIASTMGMATTLSVLNMASGCGDECRVVDFRFRVRRHLHPEQAGRQIGRIEADPQGATDERHAQQRQKHLEDVFQQVVRRPKHKP